MISSVRLLIVRKYILFIPKHHLALRVTNYSTLAESLIELVRYTRLRRKAAKTCLVKPCAYRLIRWHKCMNLGHIKTEISLRLIARTFK